MDFGTMCLVWSGSSENRLRLQESGPAGDRGPLRHLLRRNQPCRRRRPLCRDGAEPLVRGGYEQSDCWSTVGNATISLSSDNMLNTVQKRALRVNIKSAGGGVRNEGYWGINIVSGRTYHSPSGSAPKTHTRCHHGRIAECQRQTDWVRRPSMSMPHTNGRN